MTPLALFLWFVITVAVAGMVGGLVGHLRDLARRRYAQQELAALDASGDLDRLDELDPWLLDLFDAVAEDAANERWYREAVDLGNSARVSATPLHDLYRRRYDEFGRTLADIHNLDEYREGQA